MCITQKHACSTKCNASCGGPCGPWTCGYLAPGLGQSLDTGQELGSHKSK